MSLPLPQSPAFAFGVTGKMDLDDALPEQQEAICLAVSRIIERLSVSRAQDEQWRPPEQRPRPTPFDQRLQVLPRLGLQDHRRVLLSSMAPGADTLAAEAARTLSMPVIGCLPFPDALYPELSTFLWSKHRIDHGQDLEASNQRRQRQIRNWLKKTDKDDGLSDWFCVRLHDERQAGISEEQLTERLKAYLPANKPADEHQQKHLSAERNVRYRAAGE